MQGDNLNIFRMHWLISKLILSIKKVIQISLVKSVDFMTMFSRDIKIFNIPQLLPKM